MVITCIIVGCGISDAEFKRLAEEEYQRQLGNFVQERALLCNREADLAAEIIADSLISKMHINPLKDSLYRPYVPPKPVYIKTDSAVVNSKQTVKPILSKNGIK